MRLKALAIAACAMMAGALFSQPARAAELCPKDPAITPLKDAVGIAVPDIAMCKLFFRRVPIDHSYQDDFVRKKLLRNPTDKTRAIAVIIGVNKYMDESVDTQKVGGAIERDVVNMRDYLIEKQHFDEVLMLDGVNATRANIETVLLKYLGDDQYIRGVDRSRVLILYSGHGSSDGNLIPYDGILDKRDNLLSASQFAEWISKNIASARFQVLTIINACYAGGIFDSLKLPTDGSVQFTGRGSWAITAASNAEESYTFTPPGQPSETQSALLYRLKSGLDQRFIADLKPISAAGIMDILSNTGDDLIDDRGVAVDIVPHIGALDLKAPAGSFFFLADDRARQERKTAYRDVSPSTSISEIPGKLVSLPLQVWRLPKMVFPPATPPPDKLLEGVNVSQKNGSIDWRTVSQSVTFAYIAASSGGTADPDFAKNWKGAGDNNVVRGAYVSYEPCGGPDAEFQGLAHMVSAADAEAALPIAVDFRMLASDIATSGSESARTCAGGRALPSAEALRDDADRFLSLVGEHYKRRPIVMGPIDFMKYVKLRTDHYSWIGYFESNRYGDLVKAFPGAARLWQYDYHGRVDGIPSDVDRSYFIGDRQALASLGK